ncbi:MAG TPA: NUDIX domain-containing protein [Streptosporangiaceae bacterium]|nr:NUDIX domain-containing protein [Streptosporangiaceae bacterium]
MTIKHPTASAFVFSKSEEGWRLGLILHPIFGKLMIPGGHIEGSETAPEAVRREVAEETGLAVHFVPAPAAPVPDAVIAMRKVVSPPWWILEQPVDSDNHVAEPHFHIDHIYVAFAGLAEPLTHPAHSFSWHAQAELSSLNMFEDTRHIAAALFADIEAISQTAEIAL